MRRLGGPGGRGSKLSKFPLGKFTMPIRREGRGRYFEYFEQRYIYLESKGRLPTVK
jgi:hypothetical protein